MINKYILKEGQKVILSLFVLALFLELLDLEFFATLTFFIAILSILVFRKREFKLDKEAKIVSPISGTIEAIDFNDKKQMIYINVSLFDDSTLRAAQGGYLNIKYFLKGLNLPLNSFKSKTLNERMILEFADIEVELLSSVCTNSLEIEANSSTKIGDKIGVFTQGEVVLILDKDKETTLRLGQKIQAGQRVI